MSGQTRDPRPVRVGYFAAAADAAGAGSETVHTAALTLGELAAEVAARHGDRMRELLAVSSFLIGDEVIRDPLIDITGVAAVDVLPPFAGG